MTCITTYQTNNHLDAQAAEQELLERRWALIDDGINALRNGEDFDLGDGDMLYAEIPIDEIFALNSSDVTTDILCRLARGDEKAIKEWSDLLEEGIKAYITAVCPEYPQD